MNKFLVIWGLLSTIVLSCEKDNPVNYAELYDRLIIKYGTTCGWCGGADTLFISENVTVYKFYNPCYDNDYQKNETTSKDEWNDLLATFNLEDFLEIDINTCYYCADGCDDWIYVQNDTVSHQIRYGFRDSTEIKTIRPFVDKLESQRIKYVNQ